MQINGPTPGVNAVPCLQDVINGMTYNFTGPGKPHFKTGKERLYCDIMTTARSMLADPHPIQCLESVMLAMHLTNKPQFHEIDRVPVGFKTVDTSTMHEHR